LVIRASLKTKCQYNHIKSGTKTKLIEKFEVTEASVHDSQAVEGLLEEKDAGQPFYAGSAYTGGEQEKIYEKKKIVNMLNEKVCRNNP
jgi:IS5 family transposase